MWIARNKEGDLRLFEGPPRRFHEGPMLDSRLTGFNDAVSVGNDEYSFWAEQVYYESNKLPDGKCRGLMIMTEDYEDGHKVWFSYEPEWARDLIWEDEPVEVEIIRKK